jgi:CheY-like chemotaxis protein
MRILVADDDDELVSMIERIFPEEHEIVHVSNGLAALERIAIGRTFNLVMCELRLPDIGGDEVHRRLAECAPTTAERMVFLTDDPAAHRSFLSRVRNSYLTKPVSATALRQLIVDFAPLEYTERTRRRE